MAATDAQACYRKDAIKLALLAVLTTSFATIATLKLNPVRARLIDDPVAYRWSSCPASLGQLGHSAQTPHPCWLALGNDPIERYNAYRALLDEALREDCSPASAFI